MNTKKFIKEVNKSCSYDCAIDKDGRDCFYVREGYNNAIFIDTSMKEIKFVDPHYYLACDSDNDMELLNLLTRYANSKAEWHYPKKKWFKK